MPTVGTGKGPRAITRCRRMTGPLLILTGLALAIYCAVQIKGDRK